MATTTATPAPGGRRGSSGELTDRQKDEYWRYNVRLTTILLVIGTPNP